MKKRTLHVVYILCSTYDDAGYPLRFKRGILPCNTLNCLRSLTLEVGDTGALGPDVKLEVSTYDDTVQRIPVRRIARKLRKRNAELLVGLVGVQSNHFVRATELARQFRERGVPVVMGGFHVSGMLAMFDEITPDVQRLLDMGVSLYQGEAEKPDALAGLLRDALAGEMKPIYRQTEYPDLTVARVPEPDLAYLKHFKSNSMGTLDTSRGCPFNCSFCTVINVQGHRVRSRSAKGILKTIRTSYEHGITMWFFTDDNLSRSPVWEELFDGLAVMREQGMDIGFMMQVDTRAYAIPGFVKKAERAGCYMVFVGMESVNPKNLEAVHKRQNDVKDYAHMVEVWHKANALVHVGYIIGMSNDTRESVRRDVETLMNEVKVDEASFFMLTPLPGSADHKEMVDKGIPMDADLNNFDSLHETYRHPKMAPGEWTQAYRDAWETFYSKENLVNILLRTPRVRYWQMMWIGMWYRYATLEGSHPMFTGLMKRRERKARRATFPRESIPRYAWRCIRETLWTLRTYAQIFLEFQEIWMLTRKLDDPKWATLAEMRAKWVRLQERLSESDLKGRYDVAAQEIRTTLASAAERLQQLSNSSRVHSSRVRKRLAKQADEIRQSLGSFDVQTPTWRTIADAERYVADSVVKRYEEFAISYVAQRRKFNAYRKDVFTRFKSWRLLTLNVFLLPRLVIGEFLLGARFMFSYITHA
ncbi:MAG: radical SAM protein [Candidatus Hydrogenedentes bacterium]|nr:radical SAM protein [Candidatus Hydrogenedentota bacterium]